MQIYPWRKKKKCIQKANTKKKENRREIVFAILSTLAKNKKNTIKVALKFMKNSVQVYESACIRLKNRFSKQTRKRKKTRPYTFYTNFSCFWLKCHTQTNIHLQNSQHHQQPPKHRVFSRHSRLIFRLFFVVELTNKTTKHCRQQSQQRRIKKKCKFRVFFLL